MEQQPPAAAAQTPTAAPLIPAQHQQEQALAWASPSRPPFAHGDAKADDDNDAAAVADASTSTATSDSSLAALYSRKLIEIRALVTDAHFRGKDLAGKGRRERGEKKESKAFVFSFHFFLFLYFCSLQTLLDVQF